MSRGLLGGIPNLESDLKQIKNGDKEDTILRQYPFHLSHSPNAALQQYAGAIRLAFEVVPDDQMQAIMGRLNRKLIARMKYFKTKR